MKATVITHPAGRDGLRQRAMEVQQKLVLNEVQQGSEATNGFAAHCAVSIPNDITYALCLATINDDWKLLDQALLDLSKHVQACLPQFAVQEVERRIRVLQLEGTQGGVRHG
ncbi:hypothetical protein [Pseudomonas aeruginosa]|uniref:hypothetical protein n=1 Tax=Pseudomonas aeruginosa TaxID=287 RepID=UPI003006EBB9|nr:hypothetical protein [Pseudomonas aeruginosa]